MSMPLAFKFACISDVLLGISPRSVIYFKITSLRVLQDAAFLTAVAGVDDGADAGVDAGAVAFDGDAGPCAVGTAVSAGAAGTGFDVVGTIAAQRCRFWLSLLSSLHLLHRHHRHAFGFLLHLLPSMMVAVVSF